MSAGGYRSCTEPDTTTLTAANTYIGGTVLHGGTLAVLADTALGNAAGSLLFNGGTLRMNSS